MFASTPSTCTTLSSLPSNEDDDEDDEDDDEDDDYVIILKRPPISGTPITLTTFFIPLIVTLLYRIGSKVLLSRLLMLCF